MTSPEPRFSRIASLIADPSRARMLAVLLGGEYRSAGELARAASISPQAASSHLARLLDGGLLSCRQQGRHRYFAIADAQIAHALEALALVAERDTISTRWEKPGYRPLKCARRCYGHLAGELGVAQLRYMLGQAFLVPAPEGFSLTPSGQRWLQELGLPALPSGQTRLAYACMDWSERQDHLAGRLASALLDHYLQQGWLRPQPDSRALLLTPAGQTHFQAWLRAPG